MESGCKSALSTDQRLIRDCILTGAVLPARTDLQVQKIISNSLGMPSFNESQSNAIASACRQRVTLIQGPPGTGKTRVLAAIVANMIMQNPDE